MHPNTIPVSKRLSETIRINSILKKKLEKHRMFKRETYNDIILRAFSQVEEQK